MCLQASALFRVDAVVGSVSPFESVSVTSMRARKRKPPNLGGGLSMLRAWAAMSKQSDGRANALAVGGWVRGGGVKSGTVYISQCRIA